MPEKEKGTLAKLYRGLQAANQPAASASQYSSRNIQREAAMYAPPAKVQQQSKRLVDSERNLHKKQQPMLTDDWRYLLQSNEANNIHLNAGLRLQSLCILPVSAVPHQWSSGQKLVRLEALRGNLLLLNAKTRRRLNRVLFISTKQERVQIFMAILFFKPQTLQKQTVLDFFLSVVTI